MATLSSRDNSSLTDGDGFYTTSIFILFTLSLIIAFENVLVIISIGIFTSKKYSINPFICSLSLADVLQCLGSVSISLHVYTSDRPQGFQRHFTLCKIQSWLIVFLHMVSTLSILMLAIDRNISLTKQTFYKRKWKGLLLVGIVVACWVCSAFVSSWQALHVGYIKPTSFCPHIYCLFTPDSNFAIIFASLHLTLILLCGVSVSYTTNSSRQSLFKANYSSATGKMGVEKTRNLVQEECSRKMSRMVSIVVGLYCVCHLPWMVAIFLGYFNVGYPQLYGLLSLQIPMVSGLCNPLLYGLMWPPIRRAYVNTLKAPLRMCRKGSRNSRLHNLQDSHLSRSYWSTEGFEPKTADQQENSLQILFGPSSHSNNPIDFMPNELRMFENEGLNTDSISLEVNTSSYDVTTGNEIPAAATNVALENSAQFQSIFDLIEEMTEGKTRGKLSTKKERSKSIDSKDSSSAYWSAERSSSQPPSEITEAEGIKPTINNAEDCIESCEQKRNDSITSGTAGCVCIGKSKYYVVDNNANH